MHIVVDSLEVDGMELLPVGEDGDGVSAGAGFVWRVTERNQTMESRFVIAT